MNKGDDVTDVGGMVRLVMCKLVNGDNLPIMGEHHRTKHRRGDCLHSVHVVASEQDIIIKLGIDKFNVNEDGFSLLMGEIDRPSTGRVDLVRGCLITQDVWDSPP
jgi:hypothetical protein